MSLSRVAVVAVVAVAVAVVGVTLVARPAHAVAPCDDTCHLSQGTPLLLADAGLIWTRRCEITPAVPAKGKGKARTAAVAYDEQCVFELVDLNGKVRRSSTLPTLYGNDGFASAELVGHTRARMDYQGDW